MQSTQKTTYQENFLTGVRVWMAKARIKNTREAARKLDIGCMALYKVMDGTNQPTVDLCISLCKVAGYSANWLFLNQGAMILSDQTTLDALGKAILEIKEKLP